MGSPAFSFIASFGFCVLGVHAMGCSSARDSIPLEEPGAVTVAVEVADGADTEGLRTFGLQTNGEQCDWIVGEIATGRERTLYRTPSCPDEVFWQSGQVYYSQGDALFRVSDIDETPTRISRPDQPLCEDWGVPAMTEDGLQWACGGLADWVEARNSFCLGETCFPEEESMGFAPDYVVLVYGMNAEGIDTDDGQWSLIRSRLTCAEACDCWSFDTSNGTGPLPEDWDSVAGLTKRQNRRGVSCAESDSGPDVHDSYVRSLFGLSATPEQNPADYDYDSCLVTVASSPSDWIVYPSYREDSAVGPFYRCGEDCLESERLFDPEEFGSGYYKVRPSPTGSSGSVYVIVTPNDPERAEARIFGGSGAEEVTRYENVSSLVWLDGVAPFE